ncbi:hypothetical protein CkP1_0224 [Citrobacter phage CkP1]|nr:hypothetical protein CkP1_0224 [Citrobacter phage CkP1]
MNTSTKLYRISNKHSFINSNRYNVECNKNIFDFIAGRNFYVQLFDVAGSFYVKAIRFEGTNDWITPNCSGIPNMGEGAAWFTTKEFKENIEEAFSSESAPKEIKNKYILIGQKYGARQYVQLNDDAEFSDYPVFMDEDQVNKVTQKFLTRYPEGAVKQYALKTISRNETIQKIKTTNVI